MVAPKKRHLLIARHAKTEPESLGVPDHDRQLTPKGRLMALQAHQWFAEQPEQVDTWWCSSAVRARSTAALMSTGTDQEPDNLDVRQELYDASVFHFLSLLTAVPADVMSLCIVAHQPTVSAVVAELTGRHLSYGTGTVVSIGLPDTWEELTAQSCKVRDVFRPVQPADHEV